MVAINSQLNLTRRQQLFAEGVHFDRKPLVRAYLDAGYEPSNRRVAEACSSRMMRNAKVQGYIRELREAELTKKVLTRQMKLELLSRIAGGDASAAVRLRAIALLNDMQGHWA